VPAYDPAESAAVGQRILDEVGEEDEDEEEDDEEDDEEAAPTTRTNRPRIVVSGLGAPSPGPSSAVPPQSTTSVSSSRSPGGVSPGEPQFQGWVFDVLAPLKDFIDATTNPHERYADLQEIAEGESGSVFSARLTPAGAALRTKDASPSAHAAVVALKVIPVAPAGSPKIAQLQRELALLRGVRHPHLLTLDALWVDRAEDALWIRMELMETSLADVIALADEGIELGEPAIARFAADVSVRSLSCIVAVLTCRLQVLSALEYLQPLHIAHRDVRSDNMLISNAGVLKLGTPSSLGAHFSVR
jgi:hypothetical protein